MDKERHKIQIIPGKHCSQPKYSHFYGTKPKPELNTLPVKTAFNATLNPNEGFHELGLVKLSLTQGVGQNRLRMGQGFPLPDVGTSAIPAAPPAQGCSQAPGSAQCPQFDPGWGTGQPSPAPQELWDLFSLLPRAPSSSIPTGGTSCTLGTAKGWRRRNKTHPKIHPSIARGCRMEWDPKYPWKSVTACAAGLGKQNQTSAAATAGLSQTPAAPPSLTSLCKGRGKIIQGVGGKVLFFIFLYYFLFLYFYIFYIF